MPQTHKATDPVSTLHIGMNGWEVQADKWLPLEATLQLVRWTRHPTSANDALGPALWETFISTTLGLEFPVLSSLPRHQQTPLAKCGCKKHRIDFHSNHTRTCTKHSGASLAHDWMVSVIGPIFPTAGPKVRTQFGDTASAGQRRSDVEIRDYLRDQADSRSLVFDLSVTHERK
jgi:hypothetical protein